VDEFYQKLRHVQKKERNNGTLARVEETFYNDIHEYLNDLRKQAIEDPFSNAHGMLKQAQIIATEICERREKKISEAAVVNIHRSYKLFVGKPQFDLVDTTPLNLTPEEEKFYYSLIDTLKNHRGNISLDKLSDDEDKQKTTVIRPIETQKNTLDSHNEKPKENDEVLNRLDEISKAKPIVDEKREPIEKQIAKSQQKEAISKEPVVKPKKETIAETNIEENPNAVEEVEEFFDLESQKIAKDTELVTMLVFDDVGPIVGVDEKVYGPFRSQDLVTLPMVNAKIFFKNRKGRQVKI
jgi:DNA replication factor GINS